MRMPSNHIRRATRTDARQITELRIAAYSGAREFHLREPETLEWSAADERNVVLAGWSAEGVALSTTRGDVLHDEDHAESWMECKLDRIPIGYPTLLLGKGATRREHERRGLHSAMRCCFLDASHESAIQSLTGIVYEDAPRTRLMQRIGYEFFEPSAYWYTDLESRRRTLIAVLPRERFAAARESLHETVGDTLVEFPCDIPRLARQIMEALVEPDRSAPHRAGSHGGA
jgi:hypothetical protein